MSQFMQIWEYGMPYIMAYSIYLEIGFFLIRKSKHMDYSFGMICILGIGMAIVWPIAVMIGILYLAYQAIILPIYLSEKL